MNWAINDSFQIGLFTQAYGSKPPGTPNLGDEWRPPVISKSGKREHWFWDGEHWLSYDEVERQTLLPLPSGLRRIPIDTLEPNSKSLLTRIRFSGYVNFPANLVIEIPRGKRLHFTIPETEGWELWEQDINDIIVSHTASLVILNVESRDVITGQCSLFYRTIY